MLFRSLNVPNNVQGVLVEDVVEGGPADEAGLSPRDIIVEVDQKPVTGLRMFNGLFKEPRIYLISFRHEGEGVAITSLDLSKKSKRREE